MLNESKWILLLSFVLVAPSFAQDSNRLKYAIASSLTMPLANISLVNGVYSIKENEGLLVELGKQIANELDMSLELIPVDRDLVTSYLMNGQGDMLCYIIPQWVASAASSFKWTDSFMSAKDILISIKTGRRLTTLQDLKGLNIGLIRNYSYPILQSMIDRKQIFPIYSSSEINGFMQLFRNPEVDAIVFNDINFDWLFNSHSGVLKNKRVVKHSLVIEYIEPKCAVSRFRKLDMNKINRGVRRFKQKRQPS